MSVRQPAMLGRGEELSRALTEWLPRQRWFAGKGRLIRSIGLEKTAELAEELSALIIIVTYGSESAERYQLFIGSRQDSSPPENATIGFVDGRRLYDALADRELRLTLWSYLLTSQDRTWRLRSLNSGFVPFGTSSELLSAEQSNTSVVFDNEAIFKIYRKLESGLNPDLELSRALAEVGCRDVAPVLGYVETDTGGSSGTTLALLQQYFADSVDGWHLAVQSAEEYAHGDTSATFAQAASALGEATGRVHKALAASLQSQPMEQADLARLAARMLNKLSAAAQEIPEVAAHQKRLRSLFEAVENVGCPPNIQRIHGDLHLGQVLNTGGAWKLVDFEGEPAAPMSERTQAMSPLRDVAGMLRSFNYAAGYCSAMRGFADDSADMRARTWEIGARDAFLDGYSRFVGFEVLEHAVLLRALELEKAIYEVMYELRNRPTWIEVPLAAVRRLAE